MLKRNVEIRQNPAFGHQRNDVVDARIRIDVVQPHPHSKLAERVAEVIELGLERAAAPETCPIAGVDAVGAGVLRDHQQLLDAGVNEFFRFAHYLVDRPADKIAAHRRNDAEGAAMVAAFGDLQICIVLGREPDSLWRDQIDERVMRLRQMAMHRLHHLLGCMRPGNFQHLRMGGENHVVLCPQAAGDDDLPILVQGFADCIERFLYGGVDETAGVDDHQVCVVIVARNLISFAPQTGEDMLGIDGGLWATKGNESHARYWFHSIR